VGLGPEPWPWDVEALYPQPLSLAGWLGRWAECALYQPWLIEDPVTGTWRGATDDDYAQAFGQLGPASVISGEPPL